LDGWGWIGWIGWIGGIGKQIPRTPQRHRVHGARQRIDGVHIAEVVPVGWIGGRRLDRRIGGIGGIGQRMTHIFVPPITSTLISGGKGGCG
jgi:hypothetical protein